MVERHGYVKLLDTIARQVHLDFFGGIIAGIGINILAALLITDRRDILITSACALSMAVGFIIAGAFISTSRAIMGEIRNNAQPGGGKGEYYDRFKAASGIRGHIAFGLFVIGISLSILLVALMVLFMWSIICTSSPAIPLEH